MRCFCLPAFYIYLCKLNCCHIKLSFWSSGTWQSQNTPLACVPFSLHALYRFVCDVLFTLRIGFYVFWYLVFGVPFANFPYFYVQWMPFKWLIVWGSLMWDIWHFFCHVWWKMQWLIGRSSSQICASSNLSLFTEFGFWHLLLDGSYKPSFSCWGVVHFSN